MPVISSVDAPSATSWGAIFAGAVASVAITLFLFAFGVGAGLSAVSPWAGEGISATTTAWSAGLFLIAAAMIASTVGGYLTGRLRAGWIDVHEDERYFRDTAHGVVTWAVATVFSVAVLGAATTHIASGLATGAAAGSAGAATTMAGSGNATVDRLLRSNPANNAAAANDPNLSASVSRIVASALANKGQLAADDRAYLASIVAARTGQSQADAERTVDQTIQSAKQAADTARRNAAKMAFWLAASLLAGAFSAALGATVGGSLRSSTWWITTARTVP
ncbi:MAG: hypothetical protein KIT85_01855 [Pseudolabrys sp.]|nr:hypothetical protein [Pseudolabrys sp.]MCW5683110.1 hypothetical protein [Pseudolabrys sp.]